MSTDAVGFRQETDTGKHEWDDMRGTTMPGDLATDDSAMLRWMKRDPVPSRRSRAWPWWERCSVLGHGKDTPCEFCTQAIVRASSGPATYLVRDRVVLHGPYRHAWVNSGVRADVMMSIQEENARRRMSRRIMERIF